MSSLVLYNQFKFLMTIKKNVEGKNTRIYTKKKHS